MALLRREWVGGLREGLQTLGHKDLHKASHTFEYNVLNPFCAMWTKGGKGLPGFLCPLAFFIC